MSLSRKLTEVKYVDFGGLRVPIFLWRGYEASWEDLRTWCLEIGVDVDNHFVPDEIQPNWLTLYTGEKYSGGRGSSYRMLVGMYVARLPGSWPYLKCYTRNEVLKNFRKSLIPKYGGMKIYQKQVFQKSYTSYGSYFSYRTNSTRC